MALGLARPACVACSSSNSSPVGACILWLPGAVQLKGFGLAGDRRSQGTAGRARSAAPRQDDRSSDSINSASGSKEPTFPGDSWEGQERSTQARKRMRSPTLTGRRKVMPSTSTAGHEADRQCTL